MDDLASLERAIRALAEQRAVLGDDVVDTALAPLLERRDALTALVGGEQRRLVTVLFADLVDFTVLSQALDPEDVRALVNDYFAVWNEVITGHGGVVEKFIGDAVMAVFGLYRSGEDDPHRALRAALAMTERLAMLNAHWSEALGATLAMRVGVDTGEVVVSTLGDRPGQEFVVIGEAVNRAARLQAAAPPGHVLISHDTYQHVRGAFGFQPVEPVRLKGIAEPVAALLVLTERPAGFELDATRGVEGVATPTVGRDLELRRLQTHARDVRDEQRWRTVTVFGDAGVGKSRLLFEFDRWLAEIPVQVWWFRGRAGPATQNQPNALLHDVLSARLDIQGRDGPEEVLAKWEQGMAAALGEDETGRRDAHLLAAWLGFDVATSPHLAGTRPDPKSLRDQAVAHLAAYLASLTAKAPVVVLLEDLHWADDSSLAALDLLAAPLRHHPVLVVATARPAVLERHPHYGEGLDHHARLDLTPLSRRDSRALVGEILHLLDQVPTDLVDLLIDTAEGNPFYLEELVKWLIDSGVIVAEAAGWHIDHEVTTSHVPPTLKGVLQARLDALAPAERLVLQQASVIGRVFWDDAVDHLADDRRPAAAVADRPAGTTAAALEHLRSREVVYQRPRSAFEDTGEFLFKHALLRDVAYESLLRAQRQSYHGLAAGWLEQVTERTRRADEYAALIAMHHDQGGRPHDAARWYLRAGRQAVAVHANGEAGRLLDRAAELAPATDRALRFDVLLARESLLDRLGERERQEADVVALEALAGELDDPARTVASLLARARLAFYRADYPGQIAATDRAARTAAAAGLVALEAEARLWWGKALTWTLHHGEARAMLGEALALARRSASRGTVGEALRYLAIVANNQGDIPRAIALLDEAGAVNRDDGDVEGESVVLFQLAAVEYNDGRLDDARRHFEQVLPVFRLTGHRYREGVTLTNLGAIAAAEGRITEAGLLAEQGLAIAIELADVEGESIAHGTMAEARRLVGRFAEAEQVLHEALQEASAANTTIMVSDAHLGLALVGIALGRAGEQAEHVEVALELAKEAGSPLAEGRAHLGGGYVALADGRPDDAVAAFAAATAALGELGSRSLRHEARAGEAAAALAAGDLSAAADLAAPLVDELTVDGLAGCLQPPSVVLACVAALVAADHPSAPAARAAGANYRAEAMERIGDELMAGELARLPTMEELARLTV